MIRCLTVSLKREEVLAHQEKNQLVECMARRIIGIVLLGRTIALVVGIVATRLSISLL